jgi:hypothetical protein
MMSTSRYLVGSPAVRRFEQWRPYWRTELSSRIYFELVAYGNAFSDPR